MLYTIYAVQDSESVGIYGFCFSVHIIREKTSQYYLVV